MSLVVKFFFWIFSAFTLPVLVFRPIKKVFFAASLSRPSKKIGQKNRIRIRIQPHKITLIIFIFEKDWSTVTLFATELKRFWMFRTNPGPDLTIRKKTGPDPLLRKKTDPDPQLWIKRVNMFPIDTKYPVFLSAIITSN